MHTPCPPRSRETRLLMADAQRLAPEARLPLVEMAAPALCQMTPAQFHDFIRCVEALVQADHKLTLFEYALQRLLIRHVVTHFVGAQPPVVKYTTIASAGRAGRGGALGAWHMPASKRPKGRPARSRRACRPWAGPAFVSSWPRPGSVGIAEIDAALEVLALAAPQLKKQIARGVRRLHLR